MRVTATMAGVDPRRFARQGRQHEAERRHARVQSGPEPHRDGVLQAESPPQADWSQVVCWAIRRSQRNLRSLHASGMLELLLRGGICFYINWIRFGTSGGAMRLRPTQRDRQTLKSRRCLQQSKRRLTSFAAGCSNVFSADYAAVDVFCVNDGIVRFAAAVAQQVQTGTSAAMSASFCRVERDGVGQRIGATRTAPIPSGEITNARPDAPEAYCAA